MLDSLSELESRLGSEVHLTLVGDGPRLESVGSRVERDPFLSSKVRLFPWLDRAASLEIVADATVGVIPLKPKHSSRELGSPLKLFDYLSVGVPTVISRLDGCNSVDSRLVVHYEALNHCLLYTSPSPRDS